MKKKATFEVIYHDLMIAHLYTEAAFLAKVVNKLERYRRLTARLKATILKQSTVRFPVFSAKKKQKQAETKGKMVKKKVQKKNEKKTS